MIQSSEHLPESWIAMKERPWAMKCPSVQAFGEMIFLIHAWFSDEHFRWILCKHIHTRTGKCAGSLSVGRCCVRMNTSCLPTQLMTSEQECLIQHLLPVTYLWLHVNSITHAFCSYADCPLHTSQEMIPVYICPRAIYFKRLLWLTYILYLYQLCSWLINKCC